MTVATGTQILKMHVRLSDVVGTCSSARTAAVSETTPLAGDCLLAKIGTIRTTWFQFRRVLAQKSATGHEKEVAAAVSL